MVSQAPPFWWTKPDWRARSLWPLSFVYGRIAGARMVNEERVSIPIAVICIGNFTVGGAGKTPTALTLARAATEKGLKPGFLSRGYGGSARGVTVVDPAIHTAKLVGDEPLLLAREALTVIARRRVDGARRLVEEGADLIIMDDGFQSARLIIDYALLVIDANRGLGNGHLLPAGPLRAPIAEQLRQTSGLLKVGSGKAAEPLVRMAARAGKPLFNANVEVRGQDDLGGRSVLAFAGIADPRKFFRTVESLKAKIVVHRPFGDHQHLSDAQIADILDTARRHALRIVTTSKDYVRLLGRKGPAEQLVAQCRVIDVEMTFSDRNAPGRIIETAIANGRQRRLMDAKPNTVVNGAGVNGAG